MALFGRETERDEQRVQAWTQWLSSRNPLAVASLVLGVFSLIEFGVLVLPGVAALVLGVVALRQIRRGTAPDKPNGARLAWGGIITSAISLVAATLLYGGYFE